MKPYGKPSEIRHGCMCCSTQVEHRSHSKSELRRLIIEESTEPPLDENINEKLYDGEDEDMFIYPAKIENYKI